MAINPGMPEIGCDGIDNDCSTLTPDFDDADFDTYRCDQDCDDADPAVNPGVFERCDDGIDNDCNGLVDSVATDVVLLESGGAMRYLANYTDPGLAETWVATGFDASAWTPGIYGVGYEETPPGATDLIRTAVVGGAYSVYTRTTFQIPDAAQVNALSLGSDFDDGYVAWINGVEVHRSAEMPAAGSLDWNTAATSGESSNGTTPDYGTLVDISTAGIPALVSGANVLAIGVWNDVNSSDDLVLVPRLEMNFAGDPVCGCGDGDSDGYECEDCDDVDPAVNPAATEICNDTIDNDCNPATLDVGDADGDGFDCLADCDDTDPFIRPNAAEICNDAIDNDCNPATLDIVDADADTYSCDVDCADNDPTINPGMVEQCNDTIDNDCNPSTVDIGDLDFDGTICTFDCNDQDDTIGPGEVEICNDMIDNDCNPATLDLFDADGDGATCDLDCDDFDPARGQTIAEKCDDGIDNDCDGDTDNADSDCGCADGDGDGYNCNDCDDAVASTNPGALEVCNDGVDNDCNPATADVEDADGDGFLCTAECDDHDPLAFPSGPEICNDGIDNDCNPATLDIDDLDSDGYDCTVDCDDTNALVHPGASEVGCDTLDNDCDPMTSDLADVDGDGFSCVDGSVRGGAVTALAKSSTATLSIVNNTFYNNAMPSGIGGAVYVDDLSATQSGVIANNLFMSNQAELGGALVHTFFYGALSHNDFFVNLPVDLYDAGGSGMSRTANLFTDPRISSPVSGNYRLRRESPLIDAADPTKAPTNDLDRVARPYDGDFDLTALPDIGAFEWPSGEVLDLVLDAAGAVSWRVENGADVYHVYRGGLSTLRATGQYTQPIFPLLPERFCNFAASSLPFADGFAPPNPGQVAFYLVTRRAVAYEGTLGQDSSGVLRPNHNPCP
jgi:hypothetical protein